MAICIVDSNGEREIRAHGSRFRLRDRTSSEDMIVYRPLDPVIFPTWKDLVSLAAATILSPHIRMELSPDGPFGIVHYADSWLTPVGVRESTHQRRNRIRLTAEHLLEFGGIQYCRIVIGSAELVDTGHGWTFLERDANPEWRAHEVLSLACAILSDARTHICSPSQYAPFLECPGPRVYSHYVDVDELEQRAEEKWS